MKWFTSLLTLTLFSSAFSFAQENPPNKETVELNRLAKESSPYLRLHAKNPVDWYPWGEEAFAKAKKEDKPIFLSIGYSTCHWCHVMERESFEDEKIAAFLNEHFVSIKLDREERPDIDKIYMTSYNVMTGESGGWPLNVFLTSDLKMFYGGTYFPPRDRAGRVGFENVIKQLNLAWTEKKGDVITSANELNKHMQKSLDSKKSNPEVVDKYILELAVTNMMSSADKERGGWGGAKGPKFPQPSHLSYLLRAWQRNEKSAENDDILKFVKLNANRMANGGIHDHLGGGFHRYTVDGEWLVPHFEKMLYDQAQLLDFYLDLYIITKNEKYKVIANSTANYVMTEMQSEQGGYYSAQDAQSEGKEGQYWCWAMNELRDLLDADELAEAVKYFHLTEKGNFYDHSDPQALKLQNILSLSPDLGQQKLSENLARAITKMKVARAKRIPPATDKKILASWNGMMIGSMARAGIVLDSAKYKASAAAAMNFIKSSMWKKNESGEFRLAHSYYDRTELEHAAEETEVISAQAQSYVLMLQACRRLYEMTLDPEMLSMAIQLAETSRKLFYDEKRGGFYESVMKDDILLRLKGDYDGAIPTSSSVGMVEFLRLYDITQRQDFLAVAEGTMKAHGKELSLHPSSLSYMLSGIDHYYADKQRVVIAGGNAEELNTYLQYFNTQWHPNLTLMSNAGAVDKFTKNLPQVDGETTIYLCEGVTCKPPVTSLEDLKKIMESP